MEQQNLLRQGAVDFLIPVHLASEEATLVFSPVGPTTDTVAFGLGDLRLTWREIFFFFRRLAPLYLLHNHLATQVNAASDRPIAGKKQRRPAFKKKKDPTFPPIPLVEPSLGMAAQNLKTISTFLKEILDFLVRRDEEEEEEEEPAPKKPHREALAVISPKSIERLSCLYVVATFEAQLQIIRRYEQWFVDPVAQEDVLEQLSLYNSLISECFIDSDTSRGLSDSPSLLLSQLARMISVVYNPSLVRAGPAPFFLSIMLIPALLALENEPCVREKG